MVKAIAVALVATSAVLLSSGWAGINTNRAIGRSALFLLSAEVLITAGVLQIAAGVALFVIGRR